MKAKAEASPRPTEATERWLKRGPSGPHWRLWPCRLLQSRSIEVPSKLSSRIEDEGLRLRGFGVYNLQVLRVMNSRLVMQQPRHSAGRDVPNSERNVQIADTEPSVLVSTAFGHSVMVIGENQLFRQFDQFSSDMPEPWNRTSAENTFWTLSQSESGRVGFKSYSSLVNVRSSPKTTEGRI